MNAAPPLLAAAADLRSMLDAMTFAEPVTHVYHPLHYAWPLHAAYVRRFGNATKRALWLGMNPGPWGMGQTGVPFGEVATVRDYLQLQGAVERPEHEHPKRPVTGLLCNRSEVSGRRLWGLLREHYVSADAMAKDMFVANYCPLMFMEATGRNRTPDKLPRVELDPLEAACDAHVRRVIELLRPQHLVTIGVFATTRAEAAVSALPTAARPRITRIPHPSPANPAANRDWAGASTAVLEGAGVW